MTYPINQFTPSENTGTIAEPPVAAIAPKFPGAGTLESAIIALAPGTEAALGSVAKVTAGNLSVAFLVTNSHVKVPLIITLPGIPLLLLPGYIFIS